VSGAEVDDLLGLGALREEALEQRAHGPHSNEVAFGSRDREIEHA